MDVEIAARDAVVAGVPRREERLPVTIERT
jgi:hypothetical protein